ncbi:unnamed protein product [Urochloa humidicola]
MVERLETRRSAATAANPGGGSSRGKVGSGGRGSGKVGRGGSKRPAAAPSSAPPPPRRTKRSKAEANATAEQALQGRPWAKLLSQNPQTTHLLITSSEIYVGRGKHCHINLNDQAVSRNLCLLRHLEQGGPCELEVTGQSGLVVVNGTCIIQGAKLPLRGGDEVIFGHSGEHCYIFQHPLRDTEVNRAESAPENQSDPNPSATLSLSTWQAFKDGVEQGIISPEDIDVTLDNFPYYLSESTKEILLLSAFIHMEREFNKCLQKIYSLNQRILLSGPSGSEMYQETLTKALAKHFHARLLILDSLIVVDAFLGRHHYVRKKKKAQAAEPSTSSG